MKKFYGLFAAPLFLLAACGGFEPSGDEAETQDAIDAETDRYAPADLSEVRFDQASVGDKYQPLLSRVALLALPGCPERIQNQTTVAFGCLDVRTARHPLIGNVDIISSDTLIHFHALGSALVESVVELGFDCPALKQPNRFADAHAQGVHKFIASGFTRAHDGVPARYDVAFRRVGDVYRLLPARPRFDLSSWELANPHLGVCVNQAD